MRFILRYMRGYIKESIMAPLLKMLEALFELLVPFVVAAIIDNGIVSHTNGGEADYSYIIKMSALMITLALIGAFFSISAQYFAAKTATGVAYDLRRDFNDKILNMSSSMYRSIKRSTLLVRMTSDINAFCNALNMFLRLFLRSPFIVIGAIIMSMIIDIKMSAIIGAVILLLALCIGLIMKATYPKVNDIQKGLDEASASIKDDYSASELVRGFLIQDDEKKRFDSLMDKIYEVSLQSGRISAISNPLTFALVNIGIILIIYFGGIRVDAGDITTGKVVALLNYMSQILVELIKIANLYILLVKGIASIKRVKQVLDSDDAMDMTNASSDAAAIVTDAKKVLRDELSNIPCKAKIGLIGPTGSGKSLILKMYMDSVTNLSKVGYIPQEDNFFEGSIAENILLKEYEQEDLSYALTMSCFDEVVKIKGSINAMIESSADNLSVGQKKRLSLARALYKRPDILLMDDVTNPLDMITEKKIIDNMLLSDMTVIVASQKSSAVMRADKIIVIDNGKVVDVGDHNTLLNRCELYAKMYYAQFPEASYA